MSMSLVKILVHIVFSTKNRYPFLEDAQVQHDMHRYLAEIANRRGGKALMVGGVGDHVHILAVLPKNETIPTFIKELKRGSSKWVKQLGGMLSKFAWQNGYGAFSIGQSQTETVSAYIRTQEEHHRGSTFQEEFRQFLDRYEMEYSEDYVWD